MTTSCIRRIRALLAPVTLVCVLTLANATALAQTAFTYQGQLKSSGAPYSGTADLRFTLYTASSGGSVVGAPVSVLNIAATDGLVSTTLDFGAVAFNGQPRWLQIEVKTPSTGGAGPYTPLNPRQPVNPAPYAMYAMNANTPFAFNSGNAVFTGGHVGIGTSTPSYPLNVHSLSWGLMHTDGVRELGTYLDPTGAWIGTRSIHPLHFFTGNGNPQMTLSTAGNLSVGAGVPDGRLHVEGGPAWTTHGWNKAIHIGNGHAMEFSTPATKFGIGATNGLGPPRLYLFSTTSDGILPATYSLVIDEFGRTGIGTSNPQARLHVVSPSANSAILASVVSETNPAISGINDSPASAVGVYGAAAPGQAAGGGVGVKGACPFPGWGVYSIGDFGASGVKLFRIDHPLDPANKYLHHACAESPEPLNIYSGTVIADGLGEAKVQLPDYFGAINRDPRYQLTAIGAPAPNLHIAQKIVDNAFRIAGAPPGLEISWRVEAVRNDRWVQTHGIRVEVDKPEHLRGKYQHPELYGLGDEYAESPRPQATSPAVNTIGVSASGPASPATPQSRNH